MSRHPIQAADGTATILVLPLDTLIFGHELVIVNVVVSPTFTLPDVSDNVIVHVPGLDAHVLVATTV